MSIPKVNINIQSGGLGIIRKVTGGSPGIILRLPSAPPEHAMGDVKSYSTFDSLPAEFKEVPALQLYFKVAESVKIFVMPIPITKQFEAIVDPTDSDAYAKRLIEYSDEIRFFGVVKGNVEQVALAVTNAQSLCSGFMTKYRYVFALLPYYYTDGAIIDDLSTRTADRVGVLVSSYGDEMGLLLGKLAITPVQRNIGRVKDGALPVSSVLFDENIPTDVKDSMDKVAELHDKGYITIRTIVGKAGYYFSDDSLACAPGDFSNITNRRVIDKAAIIAYDVYSNELLEEVTISAEGTLDIAYVKYLQGIIENAINANMTAGGEINSVECYVDPDQNVLSTNKVNIRLSIVPVGYSKTIDVSLGFSNPQN